MGCLIFYVEAHWWHLASDEVVVLRTRGPALPSNRSSLVPLTACSLMKERNTGEGETGLKMELAMI